VKIAFEQNRDINNSEQKIIQNVWEGKETRMKCFSFPNCAFIYTKLDQALYDYQITRYQLLKISDQSLPAILAEK